MACTGRSTVHRVTHARVDGHEACDGTPGIAEGPGAVAAGQKGAGRMDKASLAISVGSLLTAVAAAFFARHQLVAARQANSMPVFLQLAQEFRQKEFWEHERYILDELSIECSPEDGYSRLPAHAKYHFHVIASFYSSFAQLVRFVWSPPSWPLHHSGTESTKHGTRWNHSFARNVSLPARRYAGFFEDLVCRTRAKPQDDMMQKLGLMRLPMPQSGPPTRAE
jgi:hypothetical protein